MFFVKFLIFSIGMNINGDNAAQKSRDGAESEFRKNQPGEGKIAAHHRKDEIGKHDGEKPGNDSFQPPLFPFERKKAAEQNSERLDALIDGFNDGLGQGRELQDDGKDEHRHDAEQDGKHDGFRDLYQVRNKRIFRLHKNTSVQDFDIILCGDISFLEVFRPLFPKDRESSEFSPCFPLRFLRRERRRPALL